MKILVLNGSPRKNGTVVSLLKSITESISTEQNIDWIDVYKLDMKFCKACMVCRENGTCILPEDDAHIVGKKIQHADALIIGTPTHWGNMCAPLKLLFDRNVPVFMGESSYKDDLPRTSLTRNCNSVKSGCHLVMRFRSRKQETDGQAAVAFVLA